MSALMLRGVHVICGVKPIAALTDTTNPKIFREAGLAPNFFFDQAILQN